MSYFEFATAGRILFGEGERETVFNLGPALGNRALIVAGSDPLRAAWVRRGLDKAGIGSEFFSVPKEPTVAMVEDGATLAREAESQFVIAVGGGSAIDAGKGIAALATNSGGPLEYLEVIGKGRPLETRPLPLIAVPTTSGTGAEVTRNAVLASPQHQLKVSLRHPWMLPTLAIVDPELAYDLPPSQTAFSGLDALTQLIEPFLCTRATPMTDALCREALPRVARALPVVFKDGSNKSARSEMALGSLFGGLALANAGLGAVHGFAAPIGGMFDAPHGAICAALLPAVMSVNLRALNERAANSPILARFDEVSGLLTANSEARAADAVHWIEKLCSELKVPGLKSYGLRRECFALLCERAAKASSMKANPIELSHAELLEILERAQ